MTLHEQMTELGRQARTAARQLAKLTTAEKNACLEAMAQGLLQDAPLIQRANSMDMERAAQMGLSSAMLDRLRLDD
ncbi:MAG TPA: gamma-glutamyl-phosphate reductase, partial [Candidatus Paceibacterota bacterium]|nr:gamma-glutamyl-phosphate reductase [Candidatus Paceibacterota bacterium]